MKLQGTILITVEQDEIDLLNQMANGCKYFKKYYVKISMFYGGIDRMKLDRLTEGIDKAIKLLNDDKRVYDMSIWYMIIKSLYALQREYLQNVGLDRTLYMEFLSKNIERVRTKIDDILKEIDADES